MKRENLGPYLIEFVGTFVAVLGLGWLGVRSNLSHFWVGVLLLVLLTAAGRLSGHHFSPLRSVCEFARGRMPFEEALIYSTCQFVGAVLAATVGSFLIGEHLHPHQNQALISEVLLSYLLVATTLDQSKRGSQMPFCLSLATAVVAGALLGGWLASHLRGWSPASLMWIYVVGPYLGATLAASGSTLGCEESCEL